MQIIKRNGTTESYDREKIAVAIRKSFISTQKEITDEAVYTIVDEVELFLHQNEANRSVERIQDEVERSLMEHGFYAECEEEAVFPKVIGYMRENGIPLAGAVQDFTCPQTEKNYVFFPIRKL